MKATALLMLALVGAWVGLGLAAPAQKSVVPDWLRQQAMTWQVLAPTGQVPIETVILWYVVEEPTPEQLAQLATLGYTILGVAGRMVTVAAPVTLYIDAEKGLDSIGFFGFVLPNVMLQSDLSTAKPPSTTWPLWFGRRVLCY
ncbi:MAG: hypothetical protein NZ651_05260 [Candidatus Bipolaricaulota bacterium]|nr:hypothetical protein [Candidatus Bipolaricaulota bacterium]MDW8127161.1 hypothetical protein [Candidatus Bipolaricaulota bacterium]